MDKTAYLLGVRLALADAGLTKNAAVEVDPVNEMPQGDESIPAEALAKLLRDDADMAPTTQTEAIQNPKLDRNFVFGFGASSYSPLNVMGFDVRAPLDTSV